MARKLPPLNALRAFEAAGRCLSISKAAEVEGFSIHGPPTFEFRAEFLEKSQGS